MDVLNRGISIVPIKDENELKKFQEFKRIKDEFEKYEGKNYKESYRAFIPLCGTIVFSTLLMLATNNIDIISTISKLSWSGLTIPPLILFAGIIPAGYLLESKGKRIHTANYHIAKTNEKEELPNLKKFGKKKVEKITSGLCKVFNTTPDLLEERIAQYAAASFLVDQKIKVLQRYYKVTGDPNIENLYVLGDTVPLCEIYVGEERLTEENIFSLFPKDKIDFITKEKLLNATKSTVSTMPETPQLISLLNQRRQSIIETGSIAGNERLYELLMNEASERTTKIEESNYTAFARVYKD